MSEGQFQAPKRASGMSGHKKEWPIKTELYGRYHGRLLALARAATNDGAWRAKLRETLVDFDDDCRLLPRLGRYVARNELAMQIEREALQFSDPDKRAVLNLALKHFDAWET
jgi:hypothetical protein